jgi:hypothetical protein
MAILYRHIRLDKNVPFYIGIGKDIKRAYSKSGRNKLWHNIIDKTDYTIDILFDNLTWEEACNKEIEFIYLYGRLELSTGTLVNLTSGGEGKVDFITSDDTKEKMANCKKGKTIPENVKKAISQSLKGLTFTKERKDAISKGRKVKGSGFKGKKHTQETKDKLKIKIQCPYCKKEGGLSGIKRWHFDNCKYRK